MARYAIVRDSDRAIVNIIEWDGDPKGWSPPAGHLARLAGDDEGAYAPPPPNADDLLAAQPRKPRLAPTAAAGKAALRDLLDEQVQVAQAWRWFADAVAADVAIGAAAKTAVEALAAGELAEAKRLLQAWRQAV